MKIAIASNGDGRVAAHAGHCRQFDLYEVEGDVARLVGTRPNPHQHGQEDSHHGHGQGSAFEHGEHACGCASRSSEGGHLHGGIVEALADCDALLALSLSPRLIADLTASGVRAMACRETNPALASRAFALGELAEVQGNPCCHHD